jgi:transcriptional regulator with XRE-family HTH domain
MDKQLILNRLKEQKKFNTDLEFADFLGIKQSTLSTWRSRNTLDYELIIAKCDNLNLNWLFNGEGSMYKNEAPPVVEQKPCEECKAHKQTIQNLNDTIYMYREKLQVCEQKRETSSRIIPQEKTPL